MQIRCPKCSFTMTQQDIDGVVLDQCTQCGGLWAERNELAKLTGSEGNLRSTYGDRKDSKIPCPSGCSSTLLETRYSNLDDALMLDLCDECGGVFLDEGELEQVFKLNDRIRELFGDGTFSRNTPGPKKMLKLRRLFRRFWGGGSKEQ